ncbi:xanthine dehydrogenase family protein subunit M [Streptomyces vinaceus]|uniref:Xanthine dehydrogenase family protein subunit M n=1 Tax=Streptomyces vinaceus TaxID=1960 RepID=A0A5J6JHR7_STRVI|nr:xanthine dehydrogenase family protein subunit M [Streptomyces vinaceus]QEV49202.1 xanthine dehydrogenase family protein subunit M [Streptomyces vinaceus]GHE64474.1 FAD-binding molybdopterin dehydrogenase [Streptomyces vinaceus]
MKPFAYVRATSLQAAADAYAAHPGSRYLGGGTNLVDLMKLGVETPGALIDLSRLPLDEIRELPDGGLRVGATVRNSDLAADPLVRTRYPLLSQALLSGASGQLRNVATTGGNLLQRTRCGYFQDLSKPCNKREPGTGCGAREGLHRDHAVLGHSEHCIATHPSDMAVALAALDARVELYGAAGTTRTVAAAEFHRLPADRPEQDTVIRPGEIITAVILPAPAPGARSLYRKARERASYAFALVSVAVVLDLDLDDGGAGRVRRIALAFGGLAHRPWRATTAEGRLTGAVPHPDAVREAVDAELAGARALRDNAYKIPLARNLACDAIAELAGTRPGSPATP